ncbi:MAG: hypothetical protein M3N16_01955 [Actinomycetota bacterium]|nr:hypothetical protein [Actinomycetota bacterium]
MTTIRRTTAAGLVAVALLAGLAAPAIGAKDDLVLVSRVGPSGAGGDGGSESPAISADGRYVAFESNADNLSAEDNDAVLNVFVRDTQTGTTTLVSRAHGPGGAGGDGDSYGPAISADGRYVAFGSEADNLSAWDNDAVRDVFVRDT